MKLRSLFLASLAAMAMVSCSNDVEGVDNGGVNNEGDKTAIMQLGFSFPKSVTTRATDVATSAESNFTEAVVVIKQDLGVTTRAIPFADFAKGTATGENAVLYVKDRINVYPGNADFYVFLNPSDKLKSNLMATTSANFADLANLSESVAYSNTLDVLEATGGIAESGHFLMSNEKGKVVTKEMVANTTTDVTIKVDRVAAKLVENTEEGKEYSLTTANNKYNQKNLKIHAVFQAYSFSNLQQASYVLHKDGGYAQDLYMPWFKADYSKYIYKDMVGKAKDNLTYCMENINGSIKLDNNKETDNTVTNIVYKAKIFVQGPNDADAVSKTFYVTSDDKLFMSFKEMTDAGLVFQGITENSTVEECLAVGLKKYEDGICYYKAAIKTGADAKVVRNNIYNLSVETVADLGSVVPKPFNDPTLLKLAIEINAWTVNTNDFAL